MKAPTSGKLENISHDSPAALNNRLLGLFQVAVIQND
jgi:hypothetical protein